MADISEKKRKRREDGSQSKKNKVDFEEPQKTDKLPKTLAVKSVLKPQFAPPVIATTPGLDLSESIQFHPYTKAEKAVSKRRKNGPAPPSTEMLLHSQSHRSMDYTAREDRPLGMDLLKHYIGVLDPRTGELQMIEARKMVVRGVVRARSANEEAMAERNVRHNMREMKNELGEIFGTKKAKKAIRSVAENAITLKEGGKLGREELAIMDTLKDTTKDMATAEELQATIDGARPVPKGHYDAEDIQDVYIPAEIIGSEVLYAIPVQDWVEKVNSLEEVLVPSRFVANRVNRVAGNDDAIQRLKVMRYLSFVLIFWATTTEGKARGTRSIGQRDKLRELMAPAPEVVIENIRRKFSDGGKMRKQHIDLLMTHCCVFACMIDNFEVNTFDLREDLKLEQKQLNQYFLEIGARMKQSKSGGRIDHIAKLALPLQFPRVRQMRRK
ncbi:RNA polymerase I associated factor, A49-like protein [Cercophora scortea]|uniref:RNA polymerase I associated factor, A49-like protein n=1 Tax=Cercophora scortea TaxID=314031 RepID=A0AAE0IVL0_9PEZI|nr:RNA polymerase I associated factor, A49-like protein [Cercophora scortea]